MPDNKLTQTEASLNPPAEKLVNIKINDVALQVPNGENLIEAAKRIGIDIPFFCYHPRLSKGDAANCRMCLVECATTGPDGSVRKMPKPQTACTMPASEGLVVETETDRLVRDRKGVLEFLLINHPLDCPVCDRGGECPLQNNTLFYGPPTSRYVEEKRHFPKAYPLSEHVVFDRERCIHCARCTRFTEDISGDAQLGFLKRGADMEVGTFAHTSYTSRFSGNVIELCPVGALLSRTYRFKARPWDLLTQRSVCTRCSNGCNIKIDYRMSQLQRVNARLNEDVNEEWTCDKGKFGHDYVSSADRLTQPLLRRGDAFEPVDWSEAYRVLTEQLKAAGSAVGGIGGAVSTNEDNFAFQRLFREVLKSGNIDHRLGGYMGPTSSPLFERLGYHGMGSAIADLENMKTILVLGSDLSDEQPIVFLRVRKAYRFKGASVINANSQIYEETTSVGDFASVNLIYRPGTEVALLNGLLGVILAENLATAPAGVDLAALRSSVAEWTPDRTAKETGVSSEDVTAAARLLANRPAAIIAGRAVAEHPRYADVVSALANLAIVTGNHEHVNLPGTDCNTQGAADMGLLPDSGPGYTPVAKPGMNTVEMLRAAVAGSLKALWLHEADLVGSALDQNLVRDALDNCPFIVASALTLSPTASHANLVLPVASFAEKDGTFTSCERRVQRIYKAFDIAPEIRAGWLVFSEVSALMGGGGAPYFSSRDVLRDIAATVPLYSGITPKSLGESGVRWSYPGGGERPLRVTPVAYSAPARAAAAV
jgi:NADH-quinone oxidoreductase subunit G